MSVESTQEISREEAISRIIAAITAKLAAVHEMNDTELEDLLYDLTRDTNQFDNWSITS